MYLTKTKPLSATSISQITIKGSLTKITALSSATSRFTYKWKSTYLSNMRTKRPHFMSKCNNWKLRPAKRHRRKRKMKTTSEIGIIIVALIKRGVIEISATHQRRLKRPKTSDSILPAKGPNSRTAKSYWMPKKKKIM